MRSELHLPAGSMAVRTKKLVPALIEVLNRRGYLVVGTFGVYRSGDNVRPPEDGPRNQPFSVIEETTEADHEEQCKMLGVKSNGLDGARFYRVITD